MAAPQLFHRLLVPAGPTNLDVPDRVTIDGIPYAVPVSPGYGTWRAEPDQVASGPLPETTGPRGSYLLVRSGPTLSRTCTGTYPRLLLHPVLLAEPTPVDRACVEVTVAGTGVLRARRVSPRSGHRSPRRPRPDRRLRHRRRHLGRGAGVRAGRSRGAARRLALVRARLAGQRQHATRRTGQCVGAAITLNLGAGAAAMTGDRFGYVVTGTTGALGAITITGVHQFAPPQVAYRRA